MFRAALVIAISVGALGLRTNPLNMFKTQAVDRHKLFKDSEGIWRSNCPMRGLGVGAWFTPERWMIIKGDEFSQDQALLKETIYENTTSQDFCSLIQETGREEMDRRYKKHLATFITEDDFAFMAKHGVNVLRLALGYWNVIEDPYKMYAPIDPEDSLKYLDLAFDWAAKHDMNLIVDLHGSPGSQNGWEHSGCQKEGNGLLNGPNAAENQKLTVEVMRKLAKRYGDRHNLLGLQVANEPFGANDWEQLWKMYEDSYHAVREHTKEAWLIVYGEPDADADRKMFNSPDFHNVVLDTHRYTCLGDGRPSNSDGHKWKAQEWSNKLKETSKKAPTFIGEWSLCHNGPFELSAGEWAQVQQKAWEESTIGSVFWSYKLANEWADFDFRTTVKNGIDLMGMAPRCPGEPEVKKAAEAASVIDLTKAHSFREIGHVGAGSKVRAEA